MKLCIVTWALICLAAGAGAESNSWWAARPLQPFPVPSIRGTSRAPNPVDAFLRTASAERGLEASPEADRRTLIRRLSFDLIGLPPSPEQSRAFVSDPSPQAYERLVDSILSSPRYGERWARHWMDAVHFAETHGHDQDRIRPNAWPYRDYLIASFNADKPYSRFVQEQVAGDVLFPGEPEVVVAMGFLAAGPWDESTLRDIREDTVDRQVGRYIDRDDMVTTVMQTFTSSTVQCARCHDHKFDPISQRDYYSLQAVFAGVDRANRPYDADPVVARKRQQHRVQLDAVTRRDPGFLLSKERSDLIASWEQEIRERPVAWQVIDPEVFLSAAGATLTKQPDGSVLASGKHGPTDTYTITAPSPLRRITAVQLEVLSDPSLPQSGPGREPNGNLHLSEFVLHCFDAGSTTGRLVRVVNASADYSQTDWTVSRTFDGNEKTAWGIHPKVGRTHEAVFELAEPLTVAPTSRLAFTLQQLHGGHCIGRPRLSVTDAAPSLTVAISDEIRAVLSVQSDDRTQEQRLALASWFVTDLLDRVSLELPPASYVYAAASDFPPDGSHKPSGGPRPVHVLRRGDIGKPDGLAEPGTLSCVPELPSRFQGLSPTDEAGRRAALARWLTDQNNPFLWRSIVNRAWHHHFGRGLVDTLNDFGQMGSKPSHPELLDWLARWFRDEAKGSLKQLHRLIVTTEVYRQKSTFAPTSNATVLAARMLDSDNRYLSRMNRHRLDAEQVRDALLQCSGRLDLRMGGPSDQQFDLKPGIHVTPLVDYSRFDMDHDLGRRRGIYRFLFRTLPDPFMDALDCPAGDQLVPVRTASVTVQQALALWNNAFAAKQAEHLGERLQRERTERDEQVVYAFQLLLNRDPSAEERAEFVRYARQHGLANLARVLINSNEFMFVD